MLTAKKMIECFEHLSFFVVLYKHHVEFTIILRYNDESRT